jgi:hypothetical protein
MSLFSVEFHRGYFQIAKRCGAGWSVNPVAQASSCPSKFYLYMYACTWTTVNISKYCDSPYILLTCFLKSGPWISTEARERVYDRIFVIGQLTNLWVSPHDLLRQCRRSLSFCWDVGGNLLSWQDVCDVTGLRVQTAYSTVTWDSRSTCRVKIRELAPIHW